MVGKKVVLLVALLVVWRAEKLVDVWAGLMVGQLDLHKAITKRKLTNWINNHT
jgi:hypothetical protein